MRIRCPACHADHALETVLEDDAARELMALLGELPREVSRPLVAYLGLWRPATRALAWERALRIAREALGLHQDTLLVGAAMSETVEAIRGKRDRGEDRRALRSHQYLIRVLESLAARGVTGTELAPRVAEGRRAQPASRTAQALQDLEEWRRG